MPGCRIADAEDVRRPVGSRFAGGVLRWARRVASYLPFHRVFHSVELSLLILVAAVLDLFLGGLATRALLAGLVAAAGLTVVGHLVAVLTSSRLR